MDGRLIIDEHSVDEHFKDPDMISGMFTAIQDFVRDSFDSKADLENLSFGENNLTVTRGRHVYIATVSYGSLDQEYLDRARDTIRRIEADFSGVIEDWDGTASSVRGIGNIIRSLHKNNHDLSLEQLMKVCNPEVFRAVPSIEFQHGLVKYTVELTNRTDSVIVDPCLDVIWDKKVLHLTRYEPEGSRTEGRFRLDNIGPGESARFSLFFDPQACLESFIRGSVTYMDVGGSLHNLVLENTLADINCPIFFTPSNANTAMLHKLMEEDLEYVDNKVYRYAIVLNSRDVYKQAIAAVRGYDIKFVMDFIIEDPFVGEAWFYGETKVKGYKVLIRVTVSEENSTVEFMVAASLQMVITGLLAELGQLFMTNMDHKYTYGYNVDRVVRRFIKENNEGPEPVKDDIVKELFENAMRKKPDYIVETRATD